MEASIGVRRDCAGSGKGPAALIADCARPTPPLAER